MVDEALFSSDKQNWETPQDLFDFLDAIFKFDLDVCADANNSKCEAYLDNCFIEDWPGRVCWMNPPYGNSILPCADPSSCKKKRCLEEGKHVEEYIPGIADFVNKALVESQKECQVVTLVPSRTDTKWFQTMWKANIIVFIKGRLKFGNSKSCAPFPSAIGIFGYSITSQQIAQLSILGKVITPCQ